MTNDNDHLIDYSIFDNPDSLKLSKKFKRKCPNNNKYITRLVHELTLIIEKKFVDNLLRVSEVIELTKDIPHISRGSSGSSLVCYLLGIGAVDPVEEEISFARFMNRFRTSLCDVDLDFSSKYHHEVFRRIFKHFEGRVARISNHVTYGYKGAIRKVIKEMGYNKRVDRKKCNYNFFGEERKNELIKKTVELDGKFKNYSLHPGGIIIYDKEIPQEHLIGPNQVKFNKEDIDKMGLFKIDILSNNGLSQLFDISDINIENYPRDDQKTINLLCNGDNWGITFGESPIMRKVLVTIKPKNIKDLAICLAIIRPMASDNKKNFEEEVDVDTNDLSNQMLIFDDDAIYFIQKILNCDEDTADRYRKAFAKGNWKEINYFNRIVKDKEKLLMINEKLSKLRKYSFCKSHSYSYSKMVWALAYQKANNPKAFWLSTLNNCNSLYHTWVHFEQAKQAGLKLTIGYRPWKLDTDGCTLISKTSKPKYKKTIDSLKDKHLPKITQYKIFGFWTYDGFMDNMYLKIINEYKKLIEFRGLIACSTWNSKYDKKTKKYSYCTFMTMGYASAKYIDLTIKKSQSTRDYDIISGKGIMKEYVKGTGYAFIDVQEYKMEKI